MRQEIEIVTVPEGWKAVAFRVPLLGESFFTKGGIQVAKEEDIASGNYRMIVERTEPLVLHLEETKRVWKPGNSTGYVVIPANLVPLVLNSANPAFPLKLFREVEAGES